MPKNSLFPRLKSPWFKFTGWKSFDEATGPPGGSLSIDVWPPSSGATLKGLVDAHLDPANLAGS